MQQIETTSTSSASSQLECQSCGARLEVEPRLRTGRCVYCGSPQIIERPPTPDRPNPQYAVGFVVPSDRALALARAWVKRPLFAPTAFRKTEVHEIRGIYLPCYLYSASAHATYSARIGENYTETETYSTTDSKGKSVTRTRTKVRTEWRPLHGQHDAYIADYVVTASRGLPNAELEAIEPFDLRALKRYRDDLVAGWVVEEASLAPHESVALARQEATAGTGRRLAAFMPGDTHRDLQYQVELRNEDLALCLLPVWVLSVRYDDRKPAVRLRVNGQTGKLAGKAPLSWIKVGAAVVVGLLMLVGIVLLAGLIISARGDVG